MIVSEKLIKQSEKNLTFDPKELSRQLDKKRPINNETPDRFRKRLAVAESQGPDVLERLIGPNDLLGIHYLEWGIDAARAVGRIHKRHLQSGNLLDYATGFLISPHLLLTNNHVFANVEEARLSEVEFNYQRDKNNALLGSEFYSFLPDEFFFTDEALDFTIVAVEETARSSKKPLAAFGFLTLDPQVGKVSPGESLTIIQHPDGSYKQIALRENKLLEIQANTVWYMTDTAQGSSGSPVFNDTWQVIALHHSGVPATDQDGNYLTVDGQVWRGQMEESKIKWLANEGIRISRIAQSIRAAHGDQSLIREIFDTTSSQPTSSIHPNTHSQELTMASIPSDYLALIKNRTTYGNSSQDPNHHNAESPNQVSVEGTTESETVRFTVPLTITVQLGNASNISVNVSPQLDNGQITGEGGEAFEAKRTGSRPDYKNREGYDPDFLGTGNKRVSLPQMTAAMEADSAINTQAKPGTDKYVLPYHHFSIVMNKERKLAFYTVVNIDGHISYRLSRTKDKWILDPRIGEDEQTDNSLYANNELDRGHLVRRLDPVWGSSQTIAKAANDDTFHFTNCSPQHADFNQNDETWQGLENYILDNAIAEDLRVSVFTGPVFLDDDPLYRDDNVRLPRQFWKVLAMVKDGKLSATAYLLSQSTLLQNLRDEAFSNNKAVAHFQVPIRTVEELTGLRFGLSAFDPLHRIEGRLAVTPITAYKNIRF